MPILALAGPIAGALGASAGTAALVGAAGTVAGGLLSAKKGTDASSAAATQAAQVNPVDINALNTQVQDQSRSNLALGNQLEQQYNPYINTLRQSSAANLNQYLNPNASEQGLYGGLLRGFNSASSGSAAASPLFTNAANVAQQQLNLGGTLDQETQNQVMRAGLARGGSIAGPGAGLGMGRDIAARDLGLTSLQLQNQRMQNAANIGSTQQNFGLSAGQLQLQQMMGLGGLANQMNQQQFGNAFNLAQFTQGIGLPQVGLSPSSVAGIATGNSNMANNANQQSAAIRAQTGAGQAGLGGQMLGYGLNGLAQNIFQPTTTSGGYNWQPTNTYQGTGQPGGTFDQSAVNGFGF